MKKYKFLAIVLTFIMLAAFPLAEVGADVNAWRAERNRLQAERTAAQAQARESLYLLTGMRAEISVLLELMAEYTQRIEVAQDELEEIEIALLETRITLSYAEIDLDQAIADRDAQEKLFHERLRAMHEQGPIGYLDILFQAANFTDLLVRLEHVRTIAQFDRQVLDDMQAAQERVAQVVANLVVLTEQYEYEQAQMLLAIAQLEYAQDANTALMVRLQADEEQLALLHEIDAATELLIQNELGVVVAQIHAYETAAAARRRQEEQARREAERAAELAELTRRAEEERARRELLGEVDEPVETIDTVGEVQVSTFSGQFIWPIPASTTITSRFGPRGNSHHNGIDVSAPSGTRINAAADGIVRTSSVGWNGGYGNMVIIDHGDGYSTLYAHNSRNRVRVGDRVTAGQHIADVGTTGQSTGNHLHFEIRRNGRAINPLPFFGKS